jgi:hypothetical protein
MPNESATPQAAGAMPAPSAYLRDLDRQSNDLRKRSLDNFNNRVRVRRQQDSNDAAALEQYRDLLLSREEIGKAEAAAAAGGPDGWSAARA